MMWADDGEDIDPNEFCVNCGAKIIGTYRTCGFCGKVWWKHEESDTENKNREGYSTEMQ